MSRNAAKVMDCFGHENNENKGSAKVATSEPNDRLPTKPKRFLTAYNYFFMTERAAFLETEAKKQASSHAGLPLVNSAPFALDDPFKGKTQTKRRHVRSHGKIGFKELSQRIVRMWKEISPEEKEIYEKLAKDDLQRYRREMEEYKKKMSEISDEKKSDNKKERGLSNKMNDETQMCEGNSEAKKDKKKPSPCSMEQTTEKPSFITEMETPNDENRSIDDIESISMDFSDIESFTIKSFSLMSIDTDKKEQKQHSSIIYESLSTRVFCIVDTSNNLGGGTGFVAAKFLTDQFPDCESISCLENEYAISKPLSGCIATRNALHLTKGEGQHALYLEWAPGIVLKEWIKSAHRKTQTTSGASVGISTDGFNIETALCLANDVVEAVANIHEYGVSHNNVSVENVIVDTDPNDGHFSVKVIDLGLASIITDRHCKTEIENDLSSLGAVLFEMFTGLSPYPEQPPRSDESRRNTTTKSCQSEMYSLLRSRVPPCVFSLIFSLMERKNDYHSYRSIAAVSEDILYMLLDADHLLYDEGNEYKLHPFKFHSERLYGREKYVSLIMDAYTRIARPQSLSEIAVVSGYSGAGKSALVQQLRKPIIDKGGYFLYGKFDELKQMEPLSAIILALTIFCDEMDNQTRCTIQELLGTEAGILTNVIPSLRKAIQMPISETVKIGGIEAQNRFRHVFRLFLRALATPEHPLVLFLDDLQWADHDSLALIESLITDSESRSLLFIGSYRDNEVSEAHPLILHLNKLEIKQIPMTKIKLGNMSNEDIKEMISDLLQISSPLVQSLADVVHRKTSGNALFVLQFLKSLYDEDLMYFSLRTRQWQWDMKLIETKGIPDSAVELMTFKILTFPTETQSTLKLIACLGSSCYECILSAIVAKENSSIQHAKSSLTKWTPIPFGYDELISSLQVALREGIIDHVDSEYKFAHDSFRNAAYSLIPEGEHCLWHLWIGNQMRSKQTTSPEKALFIAVGQLNKGAMLIDDVRERVELSRLNLQAAEIAISFAAYVPASQYLKTGINLLDENGWMNHYSLCLKLKSLYAEVLYCKGDFEEMDIILNDLFAHSKCLDDEIPAHFVRIGSLSAQGKQQLAFEYGCHVMSQLGEPIPIASDMGAIFMEELSKTKQMLKGKTDDDILSLKAADNIHKIAAMRLVNIMVIFAFLARQKEYPLLILKMVQMSLCHGICNESIISFASYGSLLIQFFNDVNGGYRFGQLSMRLVEKLQARECLARVYVIYYTGINAGTQHHHLSLEPLEYAAKEGLRYGDILYSMIAARQYCIHSFNCGEQLATVELKFKKYGEQMKEHNQITFWKLTLPYRQTALNLMGHSSDPLELTGEAMDQTIMLEEALQNKNSTLIVQKINHLRSWLAYIFCNYELASRIADCELDSGVADMKQTTGHSSGPIYWRSERIFLSGLISFAMDQHTNEAKWKINGQIAIEKMKVFARHAPSNHQHRFLLLQAESESVLGKNDDAAKLYDNAISTAGKNGFIQDQAIAYERAAIFYNKQSKNSVAAQYYSSAHEAYLKWGALRKANHLHETLPL